MVSRWWPRSSISAIGAVSLLSGLLVAYPLVRFIWSTFHETGSNAPTLSAYVRTLSTPSVISALGGTLQLTLATVLVAVPVAALLAWIITSTDAPGAKFLAPLPLIWLAVSPLLAALGWLILLAPTAGLVNIALRRLPFFAAEARGPLDANSLPVLVAVMAIYTIPYAYGPIAAALGQVDASLLEAAEVAGADHVQVIWRTLMPLILPGILAAALLSGVSAAAQIGIPLILAPGTGVSVLPTLIFVQMLQQGAVEAARVESVVLSLLTVIGLAGYGLVLRGRAFTTVGGKGLRTARFRLRAWRYPATALIVAFVIAAIACPLFALGYLSLVPLWTRRIFDEPLSLVQYGYVMTQSTAISGLINSTWLTTVSASIVTGIGLVIAVGQLRRSSRLSGVISLITTMPLGIPGVAIGVAVLTAFIGPPLPLYGTAAILVVGYVIHALPLGVRNSEAGLRQLATELEEAAHICGDSSIGTIRRVTWPLLRRSILVGWGLTFITLFRDLSVSVFLYTPATVVSSVALFNIFSDGNLPASAAYAVITAALSGVIVWGVLLVSRSRASDIGTATGF